MDGRFPLDRSAVQPDQHLLQTVERLGHLGVQLAAPPGGLHPVGGADEQGQADPALEGAPAAGWPPVGTGSAGRRRR